MVEEFINWYSIDPKLKIKYPTLDIENLRECVTPYMFAILKEQFQVSELLLKNGNVDKYYKNINGEHVYRMAKRLKLRKVMRYIYSREVGDDLSKSN